MENLVRLGERAEEQLKAARDGRPSLEVRRRVELLLARLDLPAEELQGLRAVEVLAYIGDRSARQALERISTSPLSSRVRAAAQNTLMACARDR
jgi:hypothetical protein